MAAPTIAPPAPRDMVRIATWLGLTAGLAGGIVLVGYLIRSEELISLRPGLRGMSPATAVGIVVLAAAIVLRGQGRAGLSLLASVAAIVTGAVTGAEQIVSGHDALDLAIAAHVFGWSRDTGGQTSLATALCIVLLGVAGLPRRIPRLPDWMAAIAMIVSGAAVLGYAYGVEDLYAIWAFRSIALHTALALFALAIASLFVDPDSGWAAVIASDSAGGRATRRQLAFTLVPPLAGYVLLGLYRTGGLGPAAAMAFLVIVTVAPLALLIMRDGAVLIALDGERRAKVAMQADIARTLEERLAAQAAELQREAAAEQARQAALRDSREVARLALLAVGGVGVWAYDPSRDTLTCDAAIAELYGLDPADASREIPREAFIKHVHPEDRPKLAAVMPGTPQRTGDLELEHRIDHPDGSTRWVLSRGHTSVDEAGHPIRRVGVGIDTTRQRSLEEQLRQSQKMEAVGQLTGGVAHDFNNLLTVIVSSVDLLKRPGVSEERRQRYIEAIANTTARAARLTGQLLAFARRQALQPEVFDVVESVTSLRDMIVTLTGSRVRVVTEVPDETCFVNADPSQFDTAIVNLAVNARDAMGGEGTLTIAVGTAPAIPALRAQPAVEAPFVTITLTDTGAGIAPLHIDRIFEPFFTTKGVGKGTGLGLSQVFGFVKQSGGDVAVESAPGQGAAFTLYMPRVAGEREVETEDPEPPRAFADGRGTCVLVVEDNTEVGPFTSQSLRELGYRPILAADAAVALAALDEDANRFDVVFSDVVMPGMSGIELGQEIRRRHADLPVVLTSGYGHVIAADETIGFELLHKPYSVEQLGHALSKAAHWRRRRRPQEA